MVMVDGVPGNGAQAGSVAAVPTTMCGCGGRRRRQRRLFFGLLLLMGVVIVVLLLRSDWSDHLPKWLSGRVVGLQAENSEFLLEGMPFRILGGSIHYFRIPREYWRDRLLKMRACGLNTLTTYVPWNLHEAKRGKFDFTGNLDLKGFIKTAADVGLWVILRPGPYICSEWDLGGLPSWLLQDPDMKLRTTYKGFTEAVDSYFDQLMKQVVPLQYKKGGPIIAVQVENEYGSYFRDINYMTYMKMALLNRGIVELLMTSDNKDGLPLGLVVGALATINFQKLENNIKLHLDVVQKNKPMLVMEYWTGWFDSWGGPHHVYDADNMVNTVDQILQTGASINLYMFHGGTNFGFMNGAVHFDRYEPTVTSYDYDALLTEAGDYTSKYFKLRKLLAKIVDYPLPPPPLIPNKASYGVILIKRYISLWEVMSLLLEPIKLEQPVSMENLQLKDGHGQAHGYVLYETIIHGEGPLYSHDHVRDRAQVFINSWFIGELDYTMQELSIPPGQGYRVLRLLVENCGRVNYGPRLNEQRKGLTGDIFLNKTALRNFKIYSLPMDLDFMQTIRWSSYWNAMPDSFVGPAFFRGTLRVHKQAQDTFLNPVGWEKGAVFVNGQNLGRYWNIGPQSTLYLPATLLHPGDNDIIIFEERTVGRIIKSTDLPFLGNPKYVA